jgi:hypothetical protein
VRPVVYRPVLLLAGRESFTDSIVARVKLEEFLVRALILWALIFLVLLLIRISGIL